MGNVMTFKTGLAAVGTAVLAVGMLAATAFADAPPAASKKKAYAAEPAKAESYDRPHVGNWGGLYAGVNLGWINGDVDRDY
ncbi:MAG: hypothetical protein WCF44_20285, partial [Candidatus Methylophosphatis roskildensis]